MTTLARQAERARRVDEQHAEGQGQQAVPAVRWFFLVWLAAFIVLVANDPGRMVFDTKLTVDLDPAGYYASLWHLWDPQDTLGALNNQAIGYAAPMAPFYLAGQLAHAPVWLTERLWLSLIIAVGFSGLVKLAGALGIGSRNSRFLAGVVFALWPTFTIVIGSTSAAVLPGMLAPWAVLPLVSGIRRGAAGSWGWREAVGPAARSGAVVLCMGGVNATVTIEALLLPGLFIVTHARGRRLVSWSVCWATAVAAAAAWWALPLLLQGKYAFNFLPYVEQAATTTSTASAAAMLRGTGNWTAYFNLGTPWLAAGWAMVTTPLAILAGAIAAACGLYGLAMRSMREPVWLRLSAGVAAACVLAGYGGQLGGPFHRTVQHLLDGPLAPFRNVYKLEPIIAATLALGLAHAVEDWLRRNATQRSQLTSQLTSQQARRQAVTVAIRLVIGVVLIGLALPYLTDRVLNPGSFSAVPRYWYQVAAFLAARSPHNPAFVVPAASHGDYLWGDPIDDPLLSLARSPWAERSLVPYGGAGSQTLLGTAENAIESGEQVNGLAAYLERAGIRYLVVRNDLDPRAVGYASPVTVHQTLALSGFTRVASFGPPITGAQTAPQATPQQQAAQPSYPAVEVYAAAGPGSGPPLSPVATLPVSQTTLVNGGPDSLLQLAGQDLLGSGQPAIIAGDPAPARPAQWAVTDGQRRADTLFGLTSSDVSYTYTANESNPVDDQLGGAGGPPRQLLPVPAAGHQTVAVLSGAAQVTVSSYGSWLANTGQEDPASAFDGDPATAWAEGSPLTPVGQWIQITFDHPMDLPGSVGIRLLDDSPVRELADQLRVSTAAGSTTTKVAATGAIQPLNVVPGRTSWLRITIAGARGVSPGRPGAGISDVLIPGVRVTRLLQPAEDPAGQLAASADFSFHQQVPSPFTFADPTATPPLARTFTLTSPVALRLRASALALPGSGLDALLDEITPPGKGVLQVGVASTPGSLPAQFPVSLVSGSGNRPWIADTANPVIHLSWHGKRRIASLILQAASVGASVPQTVKISSPDGAREADIGFAGLVVFSRSLTTDRIDVSFPRVQQATMISSTGQVSTLPIGLSRLSVPALANLRVITPDERAKFSLACGQGPALTVDGQVYQTSVSGTIGELSRYLPLRVRLCAPGGTLTFGAGQHTLAAAAAGTFAVTDLSLTSASSHQSSATASDARTVTIRSWQPDQRRLTIGPGTGSYLEVHENYNSGWAATLNGHQLTPVRLDGWQQGFVVPAGPGGTIALSFRPAASYHLALAASLLAVVVLLVLAVWSSLTQSRKPGPAEAELPGSGLAGRALVGSELPGTGVADTGLADTGLAGHVHGWLGLLGVAALILVAGGPVALAVPVLGWLAWRRPRSLPVLAFAGMAASGLLAAATAQRIAPGHGAFGAPAQACALVALAAALIPATERQRRQDPPREFSIVDELSCYFDSAAEPNNVHMEVWLPGHLDAERLREAAAAMLAGQPRARARRAAGGSWHCGYTWEFPPQADHDLVSVTSWQAETELESARARFLAAAPPLDHSPPFRLLLASGPGRDSLILNAHHAAFDGHSCLRMLRLIADQYSLSADQHSLSADQHSAAPPPVPPEPPALAPPNGASVPRPQDGHADRLDPPVPLANRFRPLMRRSARIAPQHENGRWPRRAPGYGFCLLGWPGVPEVPRHQAPQHDAPQRGNGPRGTVNDLLVAALIETIRRWNAARGRRRNADRRIRISMPADARPPGRGDELGNLSRLCTVTAEPHARAGRDLVAAVADQTRQAKSQPGPQVQPPLAAVARARLPVAVKRPLLRLAMRCLGWLIADTSLISNLGNVTDPPRFGPLSPTRMWFSTSAHMPRGLSVGAITIEGRLQLCFRYRRALLDDAAAGNFAAAYAAALSSLAGPSEPPATEPGG